MRGNCFIIIVYTYPYIIFTARTNTGIRMIENSIARSHITNPANFRNGIVNIIFLLVCFSRLVKCFS